MDDDRLDERVAAEIRSRLMQQVVADRRRRPATPGAAPARRPRGFALPVLTTVAVAIVVVAVSIAVLLAPRPPQPATPFEDRPRMFGGSCGAVLPMTTVRGLVGGPVGRPVEQARAQVADGEAHLNPLLLLGGIDCAWGSTAGPRDGGGLEVVAAPAALAPAHPAGTSCDSSSEGGRSQWGCSFSRIAHGVWFTGLLTTRSGDERATRAQLQRLGAALVAASREPDVAVPLRPRAPGSWSRTSDCAALVTQAGLRAVLGAPSLVGEDGNGGGTQLPEGRTQAERRIGLVPCIGQADAFGFEFAVVPGGGALASLVEADPTATRRRVGGRTVVVTRGAAGATAIHAFDGANQLVVLADGMPVDRAARVVGPLLQVLDRTRTR